MSDEQRIPDVVILQGWRDEQVENGTGYAAPVRPCGEGILAHEHIIGPFFTHAFAPGTPDE